MTTAFLLVTQTINASVKGGKVCYPQTEVYGYNGTDSPGRLVIDPNGFPPVVYDYAILKVEGVNDLPFLELGNPDEVMPGDNICCNA